MIFENFHQVIRAVREKGRCRVCVASADDVTVLGAVRDARKEDFVDFTLVGHEERIWRLAIKAGLNLQGIDIIDVAEPLLAVERAVREVGKGACDVLMKGMVNSADFLHAVLSPEGGLRTSRILSHVAVLEVSGYYRLIFITDGGLNVSPDYDQKTAIVRNAIQFLHSIGIETPKVAFLSANEKVSPKVPSTLEAQKFVQAAARGEFPGCLLAGPLGLDAAVNEDAAIRKEIDSPVAGRADLLVVPGIEAGNMLAKSIVYFAQGRMAGLVLGAAKPVILTSRNEPAYGKLASIALAALSVVGKK